MRFEGLVAVVTGGSGGIGAATCRLLAAEGATVFVQDKDGDSARALARLITGSGGRAYGIPGDVSVEASVESNVREVMGVAGRVDLLVNNAGIGTVEPAERYSRWNEILGVNLTGQFYWAKAVGAASMIPNRSGSIVNVSSMAGLTGIPEDVGYVSSKHGIIGLTKALAVEWARYGIRVNCLCPGATETTLIQSLQSQAPERFMERRKRIPLGRMGTPEDQARSIAFLLSDDASYVTGLIMNNDGGQLALYSGMSPPAQLA